MNSDYKISTDKRYAELANNDALSGPALDGHESKTHEPNTLI